MPVPETSTDHEPIGVYNTTASTTPLDVATTGQLTSTLMVSRDSTAERGAYVTAIDFD